MFISANQCTYVSLPVGGQAEAFCEDEIVAGDVITVGLDPDVFKMMHEATDLWSDSLAEVSRAVKWYQIYIILCVPLEFLDVSSVSSRLFLRVHLS